MGFENNELWYIECIDHDKELLYFPEKDDHILMQYTGLKDKNGIEIYEGDILVCHHKTKGNVFFHDGSYRLSSDQCELNVEDIHSYDDLNQYLIEDNNLVIIGNIYENHELLEETK